MSVAKNIEKRLEGLVEGFFARVFKSGLQPVEVGRRILREMDDGRTVSVNRTYAPNDYVIGLGPDDYGRFSQMEVGLAREFSELIIEQAKEKRWNLMGSPRISFEEDGALGKGRFTISASLTADPSVPGPAASIHPPTSDAGPSRPVAALDADDARPPTTLAELIVMEASGQPKQRISVTRAPVTIGRIAGNDIVIADANVSRRHAELRLEQSAWVLIDLGSTNGTLVNDKVAVEHRLRDGDRISFGSTDLIFKSDR